ncbi:unnamed protein product, partial [Iphiclides podalirius]
MPEISEFNFCFLRNGEDVVSCGCKRLSNQVRVGVTPDPRRGSGVGTEIELEDIINDEKVVPCLVGSIAFFEGGP